jgi:hypothetical protein
MGLFLRFQMRCHLRIQSVLLNSQQAVRSPETRLPTLGPTSLLWPQTPGSPPLDAPCGPGTESNRHQWMSHLDNGKKAVQSPSEPQGNLKTLSRLFSSKSEH